METEDEWADRMWREMQEKRRQKAAAEMGEQLRCALRICDLCG